MRGADKQAGKTQRMGKIIWVASYPTSGSTWVRAFLANLFGTDDRPRDLKALDESSITSRGYYDTAAGRPTKDMGPEDIVRLRGNVQEAIVRATSDSVFVKTHSWFGDQFNLPLIHPDLTAGAIYVVRNPVDVAVSAAHHYGVDVKAMVDHMADQNFRTAPSDKHVVEYVSSWSQNVASWTWQPHPKVVILRYEDLYAAPEQQFGQLVRFLGLKPPQSQFERALRHSAFAALPQHEQKRGSEDRSASASAFVRYSQPGEGAKALSPGLIQSILQTHGQQMQRFGYAAVKPQ
jgi:hypothetical protein